MLKASAQSPKKIALSISIGEYAKGSGWSDLGSANDANLLSEALTRQGFQKKDITILQNQQATKKAIEKAFEKDLIPRVQEGDFVIFHFSGHGQQVQDKNADEVDGYDEALVPYDSPMQFIEGVYEGNKLFTDDELNLYLTELRKKLSKNGQLLVLIDACHSGTATRGYGNIRGNQYSMAPESYKPLNSKDSERGFFQSTIQNQTEDLAPMITFSASSAQELNYEYLAKDGLSYGPLSYAFAKSITQIESSLNYRSLFDLMQQQMAIISPQQTPQAEGSLDLEVFDGDILESPFYNKVLRIYDAQTLIIDQGQLSGLSPGSRIKFYPFGTTDTTKLVPIITGQITHSLPLISEVFLDKKMSSSAQLRQAWGIVAQQNYGELKIELMLKIADLDKETTLIEKIKQYEVIQISDKSPDLVLEEDIQSGSFLLKSRENKVIAQEEIWNTSSINTLIERILAYAQASFLRQLDVQSDELALALRLIPVTTKLEKGIYQVDKKLDISDFLSPHLTLKEGDSFIVEIENQGNTPAYFSLLDVQADHQLSIVLPNSECRLEASDLYIKPGQKLTLDCIIDVYPPYGKDILKLIATEVPLDLSRIIEKRGQNIQPNNPFEMLFQATFKESNPERSTPSIPPSSANIYSLVFEITP